MKRLFHREEISGFVLVGGASSRMGKNKPRIEFGGVELFERAAAALRPNCSENITLIGEGAELLSAKSRMNLNSLPDVPVEGFNGVKAPLFGVLTSLLNSKTPWAAVLACDLPFVTGRVIAQIASCISMNVDAVVPLQRDGMPQPLCAFYYVPHCLPLVEQMLESRDLKMLRLLGRLDVRYVPFEDIEKLPGSNDLFLNVNKPADLEIGEQGICDSSA